MLKPKKTKKAKIEAAQTALPTAAPIEEAEAAATGTGNATSAAAPSDLALDKAKSKKKKKKSKPDQVEEPNSEPAGSKELAKPQDLATSQEIKADESIPLIPADQQPLAKRKKKKADKQGKIAPEVSVAEEPNSVASPAKKRKKSSAAANAANADAVAKESKIVAAPALEAAVPDQKTAKKPKKKKAAKELTGDTLEEKNAQSPQQLVSATAASKPESAPANAPVSKKSKKQKAKAGEAVAEIAQIDAEVQAKLAETGPPSETPAEPAENSNKKRKKDKAAVETGCGTLEEGTRKKKKRRVAPADAQEAVPQTAQVSSFRARSLFPILLKSQSASNKRPTTLQPEISRDISSDIGVLYMLRSLAAVAGFNCSRNHSKFMFYSLHHGQIGAINHVSSFCHLQGVCGRLTDGSLPLMFQEAEPAANPAVPAASAEEIQDAALDGEAAGLLENELAKQMEAEAIIGPAETRKGTAAKAFQRVKADEWLNSKAARNNSYEATFGNQGWGAKAQEVLGQVQNPPQVLCNPGKTKGINLL